DLVLTRRRRRHDPRPRRRGHHHLARRAHADPPRRGPAEQPSARHAHRRRCVVSQAHALSALAGLLVVAAGLGGLLSWQSSSVTEARDAAEARGEWRPPCAQRLGAGYTAIEPVAQQNDAPPRTLLFGVDRSPSNLALADEQMDAVVAHAATLPAHTGVGVLLIS